MKPITFGDFGVFLRQDAKFEGSIQRHQALGVSCCWGLFLTGRTEQMWLEGVVGLLFAL